MYYTVPVVDPDLELRSRGRGGCLLALPAFLPSLFFFTPRSATEYMYYFYFNCCLLNPGEKFSRVLKKLCIEEFHKDLIKDPNQDLLLTKLI